MKVFLITVLLAVAGVMLWIRLAPSQPEQWHVEPGAAEDPGEAGVKIVTPFAGSPDAVMAAFDAVAMNAPRVTRLAGDVGAGHVTYVARSLVWGFPDYVSVRVTPDDTGEGAMVAVLSRLRFGGSDHGVNGARMEDWLAQVETRLDP